MEKIMTDGIQDMSRRNALRALGVTVGGASVIMAGGATAKQDDSTEKGPLKLEKTITAITMGAGQRGSIYGKYALEHPDQLNIIGVAEPRPAHLADYVKDHNIPEENQFVTWEHVLERPKFADTLIISMPDHLHYEPCMKALELGYDVLLEKPMAQTEQECRDLLAMTEKTGKIVGISHVLRYAPYFVELRDIVQSGAIGDVVSVQHLEPISFRHMNHSYVRGNWHSSKASTPIILAKSCHDLDIIRWIIDKPCTKIAAFGEVSFYKEEHAPEGSSDRCISCKVKKECPFNAMRVYMSGKYPVERILDVSKHAPRAEKNAALLEEMKTGNYGRCVFRSDNDQPEHIVTSMEFEGGITANFSMEGMCSYSGRRTRIMGTKGDIVGDMKTFTHADFLTGKKIRWEKTVTDVKGYGGHGHGGGDVVFISDFLEAVSKRDMSVLTSTVKASVERHVMGFRAEKSRLGGKIEKVDV
jgi:predicted dehydrogenase